MLNKPIVIWFTGLSGAGKSTLAENLAQHLSTIEKLVMIYDGDRIREAKKTLGFSKEDRIQHNLEIISSVKKEVDYNFILIATICPYQYVHDYARQNLENYFEVYVSTPIEVCEARDPKGLYKKARQNVISNFTGIHDPYEVPKYPDLTLDTSLLNEADCIQILIDSLLKKGFL